MNLRFLQKKNCSLYRQNFVSSAVVMLSLHWAILYYSSISSSSQGYYSVLGVKKLILPSVVPLSSFLQFFSLAHYNFTQLDWANQCCPFWGNPKSFLSFFAKIAHKGLSAKATNISVSHLDRVDIDGDI